MKVERDERMGTDWFHAGARRWLCVEHYVADVPVTFDDLGEVFYRTRAVRIRFESGWEVSVIWGSVTYSTNHEHPVSYLLGGRKVSEFCEEPDRVEVAVITRDGQLAGGDVMGYLDENQVIDLLDRISVLPSDAQELPEA